MRQAPIDYQSYLASFNLEILRTHTQFADYPPHSLGELSDSLGFFPNKVVLSKPYHKTPHLTAGEVCSTS